MRYDREIKIGFVRNIRDLSALISFSLFRVRYLRDYFKIMPCCINLFSEPSIIIDGLWIKKNNNSK